MPHRTADAPGASSPEAGEEQATGDGRSSGPGPDDGSEATAGTVGAPDGHGGARRRGEPAPPAADDDPEGTAASAAASLAPRIWWSVCGIIVIGWGLALFGYVDIYPWLSLPIAFCGLWGLATILVSWYPTGRGSRWLTAFGWATLLVSVAAFLIWSYLQVVTAPSYGTDEIAFDQYAAQLVTHGLNPYTHSMAPAFSLFHLSPNGYTFHLNGTPVTTLSYPSLSFLLYVPLLVFGWKTQMAVGANVLAWGFATVLAYALLPTRLRPVAIVIGSASVYIGYAVGGVTDALFVPLLIGAVAAWDRFPTQRGLAAWRGPLLLGLALAVKQTPWLLVPFLLAGIALEARRQQVAPARSVARYAAIAFGAFLVPNLPYLLAAPHAWLSGVLTPFSSGNVPAGQGLVGLSLFLGLGGGSLQAYSLALVVVFATLLLVFVGSYPRCKAWAILLPSIVLFFSPRSFGSYFVTLFPAALVAALTVRPPRAGLPRVSRSWRRAMALGGVACLVAVVLAVATPAPLQLTITSVRTTGQLATVAQIGVRVTNHSGRAEQPAFSVESGGDLTAFWIADGPPRLGAGQSADYTLLSPNFFAQPPITGGFQIVAFTSGPATVSRSASYLPTVWHVALVPDAINQPVPVGQPVTVRAELVDRLDRPVHQGGVPIYLGQIIYEQNGLVYSTARINGGQAGQTPVSALTDTSGVATFVIRSSQATSDPVYFEANLVNQRQFYPYGYSEILPIRFVRR